MSISEEDFSAQWRASAHEAVPYSNDFPECLLVLPELIDGAIGQGKATRIIIEIKLNDNNTGFLKVTDNGKGVSDPHRLLSWASKESSDLHHRYGHGSKKCLTKWNKDYNAKWCVKYRKQQRKGLGSLFEYSGPYHGLKKLPREVEDDNETELVPSGLEWYIDFDQDILKHFDTPNKIFKAIKEIIRTRYSRKYFSITNESNEIVPREFIVQVSNDNEVVRESSLEANWKTFEECVRDEVTNGNCILINETVDVVNNVKFSYSLYHLNIDGHKDFALKNEFPTYGPKNINSSRVHIAIDGRTIEHSAYWKFVPGKTKSHNDYNGLIGFVNFEGDYNLMPTPCTTKVSFYENCPNYNSFKELLQEINQKINFTPAYKPKPNTPTTPSQSPILGPKSDLTGKTAQGQNQPNQTKIKLPKIFFDITCYDEYWKLVHFKFKCSNLMGIHYKNLNTGQEANILDNHISINNLNPDIDYTFEFYGHHYNAKTETKTVVVRANKKIKPLKPVYNLDFEIDDKTHDIYIDFMEPLDIGLPITHVLIYTNGSKIPKEYEYNKRIKLNEQIHKSTKMSIAYKNDFGIGDASENFIVKVVPCERKNFSEAIKQKALKKYEYKCAVSGIKLDEVYTRIQYDHKDGFNCNNSLPNCQPLLPEIHDIKTNNPSFYNKLVGDPRELYEYKKYRIKILEESM